MTVRMTVEPEVDPGVGREEAPVEEQPPVKRARRTPPKIVVDPKSKSLTVKQMFAKISMMKTTAKSHHQEGEKSEPSTPPKPQVVSTTEPREPAPRISFLTTNDDQIRGQMGSKATQQVRAREFNLKWKAKPDKIDDDPRLYKEVNESDQAVYSILQIQQDQRAEEDVCQDHKEQSEPQAEVESTSRKVKVTVISTVD